jgi:hypothetical protein
MEEPSVPTARSSTSITVSGEASSRATRAVIILVVLAMGRRVCAFFSSATAPLSPSIKTALTAEREGDADADSSALAGRMIIPNTNEKAKKRHKILRIFIINNTLRKKYIW